ncbi:Paf1-domain-containing protein [Xylariaceae sp. FL0255]|nr:Paf1-domain-containing protein [Xylariaceae sp. FL0255]
MASSSRNGGEPRAVHQDYVARIRFSNALPPPPNPPKLLDIPNTGLSSGQYTAPGFAARLAREQPVNIEADAELGMPLDLVGMPKIFDGDESSIQAPSQPPPISSLHPQDRALLRSLQTLGKPKLADASVSFLRRTEYISSVTHKGKHEKAPLRTLNSTNLRRPLKRPSPEPDQDSPAYVKRKIDHSFSVAAISLKDPNRVKHPTNRNAKLVDSFPLIPDMESFPDYGGYFTFKFSNKPVDTSGAYDRRLLNSILRPSPQDEEEENAYKLAKAQHEKDPNLYPKPTNPQTYDLYLAENMETSQKFNERWDPMNPEHDEDDLYTSRNMEDEGCFQFRYIRRYETKDDITLDITEKYNDELLLAFNEDDMVDQKAVYYIPVMHRSIIKPQRSKTIHRNAGLEDEKDKIPDRLAVTITDFEEANLACINAWKTDPFKDPFQDARAEADDENENENEEEEEATNGHKENDHAGSNTRQDSDEDQDAEGDEED